MTLKERIAAACQAADEAAAELHLAHLCVAAAYRLQESAEERARHPLAALVNPCIAAAAALNVGLNARRSFERLACLCEQFAETLVDNAEKRAVQSCATKARARVRQLAKLVADDAREFGRDCRDIAARLGFDVVVVPDEGDQEGGSN
jgi:hypothetical protein